MHVRVLCLKAYGDCNFCVVGATLGNSLPEQIRKFSSLENVKCSLLRVAFCVKYILSPSKFYLFVQRLSLAPASKGDLLFTLS